MQRPVHPSCGRVKHTVDGCLFVWTVKQKLNSYVSRSPLRWTAQSALHIMLLSYYIGMCVFHERQRDMTSVKHNVFLVSGIKTGCLTEKRETICVH